MLEAPPGRRPERGLRSFLPLEPHQQKRWKLPSCLAASHVSIELRVAAVRAAHSLGVRVVVAPFEADGQLAWFHFEEGATRVLTNDSDLGALGCNVVRVPPRAPLSFIEDRICYL